MHVTGRDFTEQKFFGKVWFQHLTTLMYNYLTANYKLNVIENSNVIRCCFMLYHDKNFFNLISRFQTTQPGKYLLKFNSDDARSTCIAVINYRNQSIDLL